VHPIAPTAHADLFSAIWAGLQAIAGFLGTAAAATATYLAEAVSWLATRVAGILRATGAMFARTWDGLKIVWADVLKPALKWIDTRIKQLHDWLVRTFKPVFQFLERVNKELQKIHDRFVKPIIDTINFVRVVNRVLLTFHIHLLEKLDRVLSQIEQRIEEPFLWIRQQLTRVWNTLDLIITFDGLYQRVTLIKSLARYAPDWMNGFWNSQVDRTRKAGSEYDRGRDYPLDEPFANGKELAAFYEGRPNRMQAQVEGLVTLWRDAQLIDSPPPNYG